MNIYQRIVLVIGSIAMAIVIYDTEVILVNVHESLEQVKIPDGLEAISMWLKYNYILAIAKSAIVATLTFSGYIGLGLMPRKGK